MIIRIIKNNIIFTLIILFNCSFNIIDISNINPMNIAYKNIGLLKMEKGQNFFPTNVIKKKLDSITSDKLYKKPKFPEIKSSKIVENFRIRQNIKKIHFNKEDIKDIFVMTPDNIENMFHPSIFGVKIDKNNSGGGGGGGIQTLGNSSSGSFIEPNLESLPIYKGDGWMPNKIEDIKINGLDDILPTAIAPPFKEKDVEMDTTTDYFKDYLKLDDVLATDLIELLP